MPLTVHVIQTGVANLASVLAGLERLDVRPHLTNTPDDVRNAQAAVLPGVGAYGAGMEGLRQRGLDEALRERVHAGRPLLAVCLGMQMLCEGSAEAPGRPGLGLIPGHLDLLKRCQDDFFSLPPPPGEQSPEFHPETILRVPHIGWNQVIADDDCRLLQSGFAYFAHSYRLASTPAGWQSARTDYGGSWIAALERGPILACQFHPELSGAWGLDLLRRWLDAAKGATT